MSYSPKINMLRAYVPSGGSRGESTPCLFQRPLAFLDTWSHHSNLCLHCHISFSDSEPPPPPPLLYGPLSLHCVHPDNPEYFPLIRTLITSSKSLITCKVKYLPQCHFFGGTGDWIQPCLLRKCSTTWAMPWVLLFLVHFSDRISC
jgi:hypothetical protein